MNELNAIQDLIGAELDLRHAAVSDPDNSPVGVELRFVRVLSAANIFDVKFADSDQLI